MKKIRIIPRLDIKSENVIKGIQLEGVRVVGKPADLAKKYYLAGADELLYMDAVASLYGRNIMPDIIKETVSKGVFIPLTAGGGIRTLDDIKNVLRAGADKVALNTAAVKDPLLIEKAAKRFGSQCVVVSIEAKRKLGGGWEIFTESGKQRTGIDLFKWVKKITELGAGEILLTSVDNEGRQNGYEVDLIKKVVENTTIPVVASGGAGDTNHIEECIKTAKPDAVSMASILHYNKTTLEEIKKKLSRNKYPIRFVENTFNINRNNNRKIISIVDYGMGNLKSITAALEFLGYQPRIINTPNEIKESGHLILPGVGAFPDAIKELKNKNLFYAITDYASSNKPLLGICLGAQLLMSESEEFKISRGLNILKGKVVKFNNYNTTNPNNRVPQIGWNNIMASANPESGKSLTSIVKSIPAGTDVYFVHSYYIVPEIDNGIEILTYTNYNGQIFSSLIKNGNIFASQFHPEKSGILGLKILNEFCKL